MHYGGHCSTAGYCTYIIKRHLLPVCLHYPIIIKAIGKQALLNSAALGAGAYYCDSSKHPSVRSHTVTQRR